MLTSKSPSGYDLPTDGGTDSLRSRQAMQLAIKLHREMGLSPRIALDAAISQTGAKREVVDEMLTAHAFRTMGEL